MITWYWIIVAVLVTNAITSFTYEWFEWDNLWVDFIGWLALIVLYLPLSIYHIFFKNTIHSISCSRFDWLKENWKEDRSMKIFSMPFGLHFCVDPKAKRLYNKIFFLRVSK